MTFSRKTCRKCRLAALIASAAGLLGCRLYDPPRYPRLQFPPGTPSTRVLMIGNSLTYYNDLPGLLQQMSVQENSPIYFEKITSPYASLKFHWDLGSARQRIREGVGKEGARGEGKWDVVVLQEFSRKPVTDPEASAEYFRRFSDEAHAAGVKRVVIFENWTREGKEREFGAMEASYHRIVEASGGLPAPIGAAWHRLERRHPEIRLFLDDRHPTDAGTYLAAAVLYDVIYGKKSSRLPLTLRGPDLGGDVVEILRQTADAAVDEARGGAR